MEIGSPGIQGGTVTVADLAFLSRSRLTNQQANVPLTTLTTPPADGDYLFFAVIRVIQAATTSSTLPQVQISFTDPDSGLTQNIFITAQNTANILGGIGGIQTASQAFGCGAMFRCKSGVLVQYSTVGYASVGATPMAYDVDVMAQGPF